MVLRLASESAFERVGYRFPAFWDLAQWLSCAYTPPELRIACSGSYGVEEVFAARNPVKKSPEKRDVHTVLSTLKLRETKEV